MIKTYSELITFPTFAERFEYLKLGGVIGKQTFGIDRYLNQRFYQSKEWKQIKRDIIIRDCGKDLGILETDPNEKLMIHHMNPVNVDDITSATKYLLDPEYLITVTYDTHNAIHYGTKNLLLGNPIERKPGDTCPWIL